MSNLTIFQFESHEVRFVGTADSPWWVAVDVCTVFKLEAKPQWCPEVIGIAELFALAEEAPEENDNKVWTYRILRDLSGVLSDNAAVVFYRLYGMYISDVHNDFIRVQEIKREKEKDVVNRLQESLGGTKEFKTPIGRIDLLTTTHVLEVKLFREWRKGLGQLLVYSEYFPSHTKQLHLFSYEDIGAELLSTVAKSCKRLGVDVTTEVIANLG
ncbi:MAG: hypothetical protein V7K14_03605 [Nostoc sp.]|uniref:hypothetical protein n=1 Tax=Nostoc sp. TaxID=1180 RepID=UPI002FFA9EB8